MTMQALDAWLTRQLEHRKSNGTERTLPEAHQRIDFASNDYLGLARSKELFQAIHTKTNQLGFINGATGSRLLTGNHPYMVDVEKRLANLFRGECCLLFSSGYQANLAVLSCLPQRGDTVLYDEHAHACMKDGLRLSLAQRLSFRHNNLNDLESKLSRSAGRKWIVVESIYSMEGDEPELEPLLLLAEKYNAEVVVDEAHSTGVRGADGSGWVSEKKAEDQVRARVFTFGKAMGVHGACVVASKTTIDYLINFARPFIFTTALPLAAVAAIDCAFAMLRTKPNLNQQLTENIAYFRHLAEKKSLAFLKSHSAIQSMITGSRVMDTVQHLHKKNLDVSGIRPPTVKGGTERIRICLHAFNTKSEIDLLCNALAECALT
jgi:8-amino-7-oxononanoate synthase